MPKWNEMKCRIKDLIKICERDSNIVNSKKYRCECHYTKLNEKMSCDRSKYVCASALLWRPKRHSDNSNNNNKPAICSQRKTTNNKSNRRQAIFIRLLLSVCCVVSMCLGVSEILSLSPARSFSFSSIISFCTLKFHLFIYKFI